MASVVLEKITKVYDNGFQAIHDLSLRIEDGEFLVLVGPSGCGKSTALRMIAGLETITDGVMRIGDRIVNDIAPKDRDIAMVFQNYALYPHMTVHDNIGFALEACEDPQARHRCPGPQGSRSPGARPATRSQARSAVGWSAAAGRDGQGHRSSAGGVLDGRATLEPRRQAARADACRDRLPPTKSWCDHRVRHARPGRGDDDGRPSRGAEGRLPAAGRHTRRTCTTIPRTCSSPRSSGRHR